MDEWDGDGSRILHVYYKMDTILLSKLLWSNSVEVPIKPTIPCTIIYSATIRRSFHNAGYRKPESVRYRPMRSQLVDCRSPQPQTTIHSRVSLAQQRLRLDSIVTDFDNSIDLNIDFHNRCN